MKMEIDKKERVLDLFKGLRLEKREDHLWIGKVFQIFYDYLLKFTGQAWSNCHLSFRKNYISNSDEQFWTYNLDFLLIVIFKDWDLDNRLYRDGFYQFNNFWILLVYWVLLDDRNLFGFDLLWISFPLYLKGYQIIKPKY